MLSFINTKFLALLLAIAIAVIIWLKISNDKLKSDKEVLTAQLNTYEVASKSAQQKQADLERKLRLTEQEAAHESERSRKRMDEIMQVALPSDCNEAIEAGIKLVD